MGGNLVGESTPMAVLHEFSGFRWFSIPKDAAVRTGIYVGLALSLVFTAWLYLANRVPFLEPMALERNVIGAAMLGVLACVPVIRFFRNPTDLLLCGSVAWTFLTLTYGIFCLKFVLLEEYYSAFHVFVLGAVSYLIFATLSWIGTIIWRVHATSSSQTHH
jgi:hypothetical protein